MNNSRILLVEDDVEGRETMRAWLAPLFSEWTFEEVNCAEAALGIIALRKDGIEIPIELSLSAVQLEQRWHAVGIVRDITARKQTEEALGESEVRFRALLESSRDAIMILDQKGFTDCNQAALDLFGCLTRDQFIAKHPSDLSPAQQPDGQDSLTAAQEHIQTALGEGGQAFEWVHRRIDGTAFPAEVLLSRLELRGRTLLQAVVRDITIRKRTEKESNLMMVQLRQAQKLESIGQLAAGIAHEINTPTQYIGDNLRFLRDAFADMNKMTEMHKISRPPSPWRATSGNTSRRWCWSWIRTCRWCRVCPVNSTR